LLFDLFFLIWLFFAAEHVYGYTLHNFGILPRNLYGLIGIVSAPFLHLNFTHIISNTIPLLLLGSVLFYFYYNQARWVFYLGFFVPNILVWILGRPLMHIGASGIVYTLASFLVIFGLLRRDYVSLMIALAVAIIYSGLFRSLFYKYESISVEMHIAGILTGVTAAIYFYKKTPIT